MRHPSLLPRLMALPYPFPLAVYDMWGIPAALLRGLWSPMYSATTLFLTPHVPGNVTSLQQLFPLLWGEYAIFLSWEGSGGITGVTVNGLALSPLQWNVTTISLIYADLPIGASGGRAYCRSG